MKGLAMGGGCLPAASTGGSVALLRLSALVRPWPLLPSLLASHSSPIHLAARRHQAIGGWWLAVPIPEGLSLIITPNHGWMDAAIKSIPLQIMLHVYSETMFRRHLNFWREILYFCTTTVRINLYPPFWDCGGNPLIFHSTKPEGVGFTYVCGWLDGVHLPRHSRSPSQFPTASPQGICAISCPLALAAYTGSRPGWWPQQQELHKRRISDNTERHPPFSPPPIAFPIQSTPQLHRRGATNACMQWNGQTETFFNKNAGSSRHNNPPNCTHIIKNTAKVVEGGRRTCILVQLHQLSLLPAFSIPWILLISPQGAISRQAVHFGP